MAAAQLPCVLDPVVAGPRAWWFSISGAVQHLEGNEIDTGGVFLPLIGVLLLSTLP